MGQCTSKPRTKPRIMVSRDDFGMKVKARPNNRIELTALRAAAHTER
jgi:hypothetical protein